MEFYGSLNNPDVCAFAPAGKGYYYEIKQDTVRGKVYYSAYLRRLDSGFIVDVGDAMFRKFKDAESVCREAYEATSLIDKYVTIEYDVLRKEYDLAMSEAA